VLPWSRVSRLDVREDENVSSSIVPLSSMRAIEPHVMTDMYAPIIPCEKTISIRCVSNDALAHLFAFWNRFIRSTCREARDDSLPIGRQHFDSVC
jgi:hypothetical protein